MTNICLSGGAEGADLQFGMTAGMAGYEVVHWSFRGHRTKAPSQEVVVLSEDQLEVADKYLRKANRTLKRSLGKPGFVRNLLRRNWYQVETAERVYAVTEIDEEGVKGGTAWATQMFIDRFGGLPCECYVFDQVKGRWYVWKGEWASIDKPPAPYGIWAGIGSRKLTTVGKDAIRNLMGYVGKAPQAQPVVQQDTPAELPLPWE